MIENEKSVESAKSAREIKLLIIMKKLILFLLFLSSTYGFSQNLNLIKKEVEKINNSKNFKIKTVPNDYFVDVLAVILKNHV